MGVTRYYEGYWAMDYLTQQGPFNFIAHLIGCKGLDLTTLKYTERVPPRSEWVVNPEHYSAQELDPFFTWHLAAGTTWLTAGFLQIFWAKLGDGGWSVSMINVSHVLNFALYSDVTCPYHLTTNKLIIHLQPPSQTHPLQHRKLHKRFGWIVCMPALMVHLIFATRMAIRNPVNQAPIIVSQYGAMIFEGFVLFCVALKYALDSEKAGDKEKKRKLMGMHKLRMVNCYIQTIFGSGAIRVSLWILYLLGHFFSPEIQARIDRGTCQTAAHDERGQPLGSAENCWVPVFLNLALTNVLNTWLLYVCMVTDEFDGHDVTKFKRRFRMALRVMVAATFVALVPSWFDNAFFMYILMALGVISRMSSLYDFVGSWKRHTGRVIYVERSVHKIAVLFLQSVMLSSLIAHCCIIIRARAWLFWCLIGSEEEEEVGKSTKQN